MTIIGYIHICQKGEWQRSLTMLMDCIKAYGLYDATSCIRLGIVNDIGYLFPDLVLDDPKFKIIYIGKSHEYERPTLRHMRFMSEIDDPDTRYFYLHTKGLRHFGTPSELNIIDWINLMLYWNIERWKLAIQKLETFDTYGCENAGRHYSGNFWWATRTHIMNLPSYIGDQYNDPEFWIQTFRSNAYCVYNSGYEGGGLYGTRFPRYLYENYEIMPDKIIYDDIIYRPLVPADYSAFVALMQFFRDSFYTMDRSSFTYDEFVLVLESKKAYSDIYVLEYNNKLIATGTLVYETKFTNNISKISHIEDICILPCVRSLGIGTYLISKLVEVAKINKCKTIKVDCHDVYIEFYHKCKFVKATNGMIMDLTTDNTLLEKSEKTAL